MGDGKRHAWRSKESFASFKNGRRTAVTLDLVVSLDGLSDNNAWKSFFMNPPVNVRSALPSLGKCHLYGMGT